MNLQEKLLNEVNKLTRYELELIGGGSDFIDNAIMSEDKNGDYVEISEVKKIFEKHLIKDKT